MKKAFISKQTIEGKSYAISIESLDSNDFPLQSFGRSLSDRKKAKDFTESAKIYHVGCKGKATIASVKKWVKEFKPSEFFAAWHSDSAYYKDDSVKIFYKN